MKMYTKTPLALILIMLLTMGAWTIGYGKHKLVHIGGGYGETINSDGGATITETGDGYFEGSIGVGTSSPATAIHVQQYADSEGVRTYGYDDRSASYIEMYVDAGGVGNVNTSSGNLDIRVTGTLATRVDSGGLRLLDSKVLEFGTGKDFTIGLPSGEADFRIVAGNSLSGTDFVLNSTGLSLSGNLNVGGATTGGSGGTFGNPDTTPDVAGGNIFTMNAVANTITDFTGIAYQTIIIYGDGAGTIADGAQIQLEGDVDFTPDGAGSQDLLALQSLDGSTWVELYRRED